MLNKKALAASVSAPPAEYVEDVFSTYLFPGNSSSQTITNGIDLAGEGGMVWLKGRNANDDHVIYDTERGSGYPRLYPNTTGAQATTYPDFNSFNSNGFNIGYNPDGGYSNVSGTNYVSWTFRKAPKFFDIVTYTGDGSTSKLVNHSLGSVPGMIMIKRLNGTSNWFTAASLSSTAYGIAGGGGGSGYELALNRTDDYYDNPLKSTIATDTTIDVPKVYYNDATKCNASGATYVMYLFASNAGGFGAAGTDNIITCGSFSTGSSGTTVTLGYEPQFILYKSPAGLSNWRIIDNMRGMPVGSASSVLSANSSSSETTHDLITPTATGFTTTGNSTTYIYMAIRRPMKTPTSGTEVFVTDAAGANASANGEVFSSTFPVDFHFRKERSSSGNGWFSNSRLIPGSSLRLESANAESTLAYVDKYDRMSGIATTTGFNYTDWAGWLFKRATGFFDVVCYTGNNGVATTQTHNLGVAPELMFIKGRDIAEGWQVYVSSLGNTKYLQLNSDAGEATATNRWNSTSPTSTVFSLGTSSSVNWSANKYVAYLFATVTGVSKVGSYTGNGSNQTINCGFTAGARFVLIKRTDSTGDWYVYDTARGIVSGNDPQLKLNTTDAEATGYDAIDPDNSGFIVNNDATNFPINVNNATYIYLAIA